MEPTPVNGRSECRERRDEHGSARGLEHRRAVRLRHPYGPDYSVALDFSTLAHEELRDSGLNLQLESRRAHTSRAGAASS
jgi:hypothetical protein